MPKKKKETAKMDAEKVYAVLDIPAAYDPLVTKNLEIAGIKWDNAEMRNAIQKFLTVRKIKEAPQEARASLLGPVADILVPDTADEAFEMIIDAIRDEAVEKELYDTIAKYTDVEAYLKYLETKKATVQGPQPAEA